MLAAVLDRAAVPTSRSRWWHRPRSISRKNDRAGAVIQLRNALQKNPDLAEARFLLGKSLLETGDLPGAEKELRKAAELKYPADEVVPVLARLLVRRGEYKKALDEFGSAAAARRRRRRQGRPADDARPGPLGAWR